METFGTMVKARARLLMRESFFGSMAMSLEVIADDTIETACTNGKTLKYNPVWFDALSESEQTTIAAHEAAHVFLAHHIRKGNREHKRFNVAADHAANLLLKESGFVMPVYALCDERYTGKPAELIYDLLPDDDDNGNGNGNGKADPGKMGTVESPDNSAIADAKLRESVATAVRNDNAIKKANGLPGTQSAGIAREVNKAMAARISWTDRLREYMVNRQPHGWTWQRPSRRHIGRGLYLPSTAHDKRLSYAVIAIDTSASMTQALLTRIVSEVKPLIEDHIDRVSVLQCDDVVCDARTCDAADFPNDLKMVGGGGTDFRPVFDWARNKAETEPAVVIYFTDGQGRFPDKSPEYPVLWVLTEDCKVPFGDKIMMA